MTEREEEEEEERGRRRRERRGGEYKRVELDLQRPKEGHSAHKVEGQ